MLTDFRRGVPWVRSSYDNMTAGKVPWNGQGASRDALAGQISLTLLAAGWGCVHRQKQRLSGT